MWVLALGALGCTDDLPEPPGTDDTATTSSTDTRPPDTTGPWTVSDPHVCESPLGSASWAPAPDWIPAGPDDTGTDDLGWLAWQEHPEGDRLLASGPMGTVAAYEPGGTTTVLVETGLPGGGVRFADFDGDGADDVLIFGLDLVIHWSDGGQTVVYPGPVDEWILIDAVVMDLDGNGALDIVTLRKELAQDQPGPLIWLGPGDRDGEWTGPVEVGDGDEGYGSPFDLGVFDFNGDGLLDLFICTDGPSDEANRLLCNEGDLAFSNCDDRGLEVNHFCMGTAQGDLDHDGDMDLYLGAGVGIAHKLLVESGAGYYSAEQVLIDVTLQERQMAWGTAIVDMDNDGLPDLVSANGEFVGQPELFPLLLLQQQSDGTFQDIGAEQGLPQETGGRALLTVDLNADGVVDLLASDKADATAVFLSEGCTSNTWVDVRAPLGTWVTLEGEGQSFHGFVTSDPGFGAERPSQAHIGLGTIETLDRVLLEIPGIGEASLEGPLPTRTRITWKP